MLIHVMLYNSKKTPSIKISTETSHAFASKTFNVAKYGLKIHTDINTKGQVWSTKHQDKNYFPILRKFLFHAV